MGRKLVPIEDLRVEHEAWMLRLSRAAEGWVNARAAGEDTEDYDRQMRDAERQTRRLERRIRRRKRER